MPQKIKEIDDISYDPCMLAENLCPAFLRRVESTHKITILFELGIGAPQVLVQMANCIQMIFRKQDFGLSIGNRP
jgi:hypothetical protein